MNRKLLAGMLLIATVAGCRKKDLEPGTMFYLRYKANGQFVEYISGIDTVDAITYTSPARQDVFFGNNSEGGVAISLQDLSVINSTYTGDSYPLTELQNCGKAIATFTVGGKVYKTTCALPGSLKIEHDGDTKETHGTFSFDAVATSSGNDTVHITGGEFLIYWVPR